MRKFRSCCDNLIAIKGKFYGNGAVFLFEIIKFLWLPAFLALCIYWFLTPVILYWVVYDKSIPKRNAREIKRIEEATLASFRRDKS
jgi:hypothetical protein